MAYSFDQYKNLVARYIGAPLVNARLSELLSMYSAQVSPCGAAAHLFLIHNR